MKKFLSVAFMLITCIFCFAGCSSISQSLVINSDGTIQESLRVQFDTEELQKQNVSANALAEHAEQIAQDFKESKKVYINPNLEITFDINLSTQEDPILTIDLTFGKIESWYAFWELPIPTAQDYQYQKGWFIDRQIIHNGSTDFNSSIADVISEEMQSFINETYLDYNLDLSTIKTNYLRAYDRNGVIPSTDADYMILTDTHLFYVWEFDLSDKERNILIYQNVITNHNRGNWFITALGLTLLFGIITFIVLYYKRKNKKDDNNKNSILITFNSTKQEPKAENTPENQNEKISNTTSIITPNINNATIVPQSSLPKKAKATGIKKSIEISTPNNEEKVENETTKSNADTKTAKINDSTKQIKSDIAPQPKIENTQTTTPATPRKTTAQTTKITKNKTTVKKSTVKSENKTKSTENNNDLLENNEIDNKNN